MLLKLTIWIAIAVMASGWTLCSAQDRGGRARARDIGVEVGFMKTGPHDAITDVPGVMVGHKTLIRGDQVRTGVTAILPHAGNLYQEKVPAAIAVFNAYGKLAGSTQVEELGNIETPVILTNTLSVGAAVAAVVRYTLDQEGNESVRSVNAVVGETNDGTLNDIRGMHVEQEDVWEAIRSAASGPVAEGTVGAGTGTMAFGYKGGIGTASRWTPKIGVVNYTVGVLVQSNFGWTLSINGVPFTREMRQPKKEDAKPPEEDGSCMIVIATDAPLCCRNLKRLARRAFTGMARTRAVMSNSSGDFAIAFSTAYRIKQRSPDKVVAMPPLIHNDAMTILFQAVEEAVQEAIYNSLFMATTVKGMNGREARAIPLDDVVEIMKKYNMLDLGKKLDWKPFKYD